MTRRFHRSIVRLLTMALLATGLVVPAGAALPATAGAAGAPPTITSFTPTKGVFSGGTSVVITGTLLTGATAVTFGDTPATSFTVDSATQITAVTPKHAIGSAEVKVTRGSTVTATSRFVFQPEITLLGDLFDYANASLNVPFLLAVGPDGSIWATNYTNNSSSDPAKVSKLKPDGTAEFYTAPTGIETIQSIAAGADGNMWATGADSSSNFNHLLRITPSGTFTDFTDATLCDSPYLVTGGDGNIWLANDTPCGGSGFTAVRVTPDGTFTAFPVAAAAANYSVTFVTAIAGDRIMISDNQGGNVYLVGRDGTVSSFVACDRDPSNVLNAINGLIGPDGNLWITCSGSNAILAPGGSYLARVTLDPADLANSAISYYGPAEVPAMGSPFFMTTGADGNIWVAQLVGPPPSGSPLPFDPTAQMLRISFPDSLATPVIEAFDSDVFFMLDIVAAADGYMYANQFTLLVYLISYFYGSVSQFLTSCFQTNSPTCAAAGIENFNSLAGIFRIDVGAPAAPAVDPLVGGRNSIDLTWTAPTYTGAGPIVGYRVKYSTHADMSDATVIDTGDTSLSRTLSNLPPGKYYVRIATTNTIVTGPYSPAQSVRVVKEPAKFPTFTATAGDGRATLNFTGTGWDAGDGEGTGVGNACFCVSLGYEYSTDGGTNWSALTGVGTSSVVISGLNNYQTYSIKVRAVNSVGNGAASDAVSVTPIAAGPSTCPASTPTQHRILVCWSQLTPAQGQLMRYRAYVFTVGTFTKVVSCKGTSTDTSCTMLGFGKLSANTLYDIRVRARVRMSKGQVFWTEYSTPEQVTTQP